MGRFKKIGGVSGTSGSPQLSIFNSEHDAKVKELESKLSFNSNELSYSESKIKIETYLLNKNHPVGGSKAKFFIDYLGYSKDNPKQFFNAIYLAIDGKIPTKERDTAHGHVLEFHEKIKSISGNYYETNIVVSIQKDHGKLTYRIITAYPDKKGEK